MFDFLKDLDNDIRDTLLVQLRKLWTHTSTAIEGNTLSLGETAFVFISSRRGTVTARSESFPEVDKLDRFKRFCAKSWSESIKLVDEVHKKQQARNQEKNKGI